jgi:hypothetical protein
MLLVTVFHEFFATAGTREVYAASNNVCCPFNGAIEGAMGGYSN